MRGRGKQSLRLPAFVFGPHRGILPAFSSFTGGGMYEMQTGDRQYAIAGDEIVALD
jgi:metallophosphoesterase superfamily enzyme